jgi:hypothetical protein
MFNPTKDPECSFDKTTLQIMLLQPTAQDSFNIINSLLQRFTWGLVLLRVDADSRLMAAVVLVPVLLVAVTVVSSLKIAPFELPKTQAAKKTQ